MKRWILFMMAIGSFVACEPRENTASAPEIQQGGGTIPSDFSREYRVFRGELPCDTCDKIDFELRLEVDSVSQTPTYYMRTVHRNTDNGDVEMEAEGLYTIIAGYVGNPTATVYQLNPGTNEPRYFLLQNDSTLRVLGSSLQENASPSDGEYSYDLKLILTD
jgi:hypothetical protein